MTQLVYDNRDMDFHADIPGVGHLRVAGDLIAEARQDYIRHTFNLDDCNDATDDQWHEADAATCEAEPWLDAPGNNDGVTVTTP